MLGGVHHVPARPQLFFARVLKPGCRFLYRGPVIDFFPRRALRAIIYRMSPMLNHATERPLLYEETVPLPERAGLRSVRYQTHGFVGFCLFRNSDVLFVNRLFRCCAGYPRDHPRIGARGRSDACVARFAASGFASRRNCAKGSRALKSTLCLQAASESLSSHVGPAYIGCGEAATPIGVAQADPCKWEKKALLGCRRQDAYHLKLD